MCSPPTMVLAPTCTCCTAPAAVGLLMLYHEHADLLTMMLMMLHAGTVPAVDILCTTHARLYREQCSMLEKASAAASACHHQVHRSMARTGAGTLPVGVTAEHIHIYVLWPCAHGGAARIRAYNTYMCCMVTHIYICVPLPLWCLPLPVPAVLPLLLLVY